MLPPEFIKRIGSQSYIDSPGLIKSLSEPGTASIRINPLKWNRIPEASASVPWCQDGYYLKERPSYTADPLFHAGCYYPQEASGMFLGEVMRQLLKDQDDPKVLDLCGAPGGKTTLISSFLGSRGTLVSNEVIRQRAAVLSENVTKWGIPNCMVTNNDPRAFSHLEGYFDIIVVDAPCSGEGMFRDYIARSEWSVANTALCTERQQRILMDVWPALKEGGILVYSTCTFNPAENEHNIKWLCDNTESVSLEINTDRFPGIQEIIYKDISGYGFHPGKIQGDGFFLSAVRKTTGERNRSMNRDKKSGSLSSADRRTSDSLVLSSPEYYLRDADTLYRLALPANEFMLVKKKLKVIYAGIALCRAGKNDIIPCHDLAMSTILRKEAFPAVELDYEQSLSYLGRQNLNQPGMEKGWILTRYMGINLGFIKSLESRVNNYYPSEWRIRMELGKEQKATVIKWAG